VPTPEAKPVVAGTIVKEVEMNAAKLKVAAKSIFQRVAGAKSNPTTQTSASAGPTTAASAVVETPVDPAARQDFWAQSFAGSPVPGVGDKGLFPVREASGSQSVLLSTGPDAYAARIQILKNAKRSIRMQALIFRNDEAGRQIAEILKEKRKAGLDVRVVVDAMSNLDPATQFMYYDLMRHGITVEGYEALGLEWLNETSTKDVTQINKRFHDKMLVVDAEDPQHAVAIVGGRNIANEYFDTGSEVKNCWRDQDFLIKGEVVGDVKNAFDRNYQDQENIKKARGGVTTWAWDLWRRVPGADIHYKVKVNQAAKAKVDAIVAGAMAKEFVTKPLKMRFVQSRPREQYQETYIHQAYTHLFRAAEKELLVENAYFIPDDKETTKSRNNMLLLDQEHIEALKNAARRGVKVTIVTNSVDSNDLPEMTYASRYLYKELLEINGDPDTRKNGGLLTIAEWNPKKTDASGVVLGTLHAKHAVADRRIGVGGSYNLDPRSFGLNSETALMTESEEQCGEEAEQIRADIRDHADVITREQAEQFHDPKNPKDWATTKLSLAARSMF